jgi:hypothetical protein
MKPNSWEVLAACRTASVRSSRATLAGLSPPAAREPSASVTAVVPLPSAGAAAVAAGTRLGPDLTFSSRLTVWS